ncbi:MAG: hypothetical protein JXR69_02555 [Candidatus Delongbacteria bacterium]|nr:hypothetical protein [Candidatus Delongbacteria bacterium]
MKRMVLMLILASIGFIYAQEEYYDDYNNTHSSDTTADEIITTEPMAVADIIGTATNDTPDNTPEQDMTASAEASISEFYKKLNIPIWYRWREFGVSATIPYFMSRDVPMSDLSASGIGDISIGFSYGKFLAEQNTYLDFNVTAKLPTGDDKADAGDGVTVSLTTETLDITGAISAYYFMDDFTYKGNIIYTMNGKYTDDWDIEHDRGDNFLFVVGADYRWQYNLTFGLNANYGMHANSENDGVEGMDKTIFMDLKPVVKYPINLFEFVAGAKIPLYTDTPDDSYNEGNRNMVFFFRTNYQLF